MKYSMDDMIREVEKRSGKIRRQRAKRMAQASSCVAVSAAAALVVSTVRIVGIQSVETAGGAYGSFLLEGSAGGYVLVGVICFCAAVLLTFLAMRFAEKRRNRSD